MSEVHGLPSCCVYYLYNGAVLQGKWGLGHRHVYTRQFMSEGKGMKHSFTASQQKLLF